MRLSFRDVEMLKGLSTGADLRATRSFDFDLEKLGSNTPMHFAFIGGTGLSGTVLAAGSTFANILNLMMIAFGYVVFFAFFVARIGTGGAVYLERDGKRFYLARLLSNSEAAKLKEELQMAMAETPSSVAG